jgi:hypothetical protein
MLRPLGGEASEVCGVYVRVYYLEKGGRKAKSLKRTIALLLVNVMLLSMLP